MVDIQTAVPQHLQNVKVVRCPSEESTRKLKSIEKTYTVTLNTFDEQSKVDDLDILKKLKKLEPQLFGSICILPYLKTETESRERKTITQPCKQPLTASLQ